MLRSLPAWEVPSIIKVIWTMNWAVELVNYEQPSISLGKFGTTKIFSLGLKPFFYYTNVLLVLIYGYLYLYMTFKRKQEKKLNAFDSPSVCTEYLTFDGAMYYQMHRSDSSVDSLQGLLQSVKDACICLAMQQDSLLSDLPTMYYTGLHLSGGEEEDLRWTDSRTLIETWH